MKKKILAALVAATLVLPMTACGGESTENDTPDTQQTANSQQEENTDNPVIELVAGEQGEYGQFITINEGTDMEESFYAYYVPAATYEVTNEGDYMTQVSVYEDFARNEETGYDEYTSMGDIIMIDAGKTDTIEIPDGWFIEIQEPTHISLTLTE